MMLQKEPQWAVPSYTTRYTWADGRPVIVYHRRLIDSIGLRGWNDLNVRYPINENDSVNVHIVRVHDTDIVN